MKYEVLYVNLTEGLDNLKCALENTDIQSRYFVKHIDHLTKNTGEIQETDTITQRLLNCIKCSCYSCLNKCISSGCNRCDIDARIIDCNNASSTCYVYIDKELELYSKKLNKTDMYSLKYLVYDIQYKQYFALLLCDVEKYIVYYKSNIDGDKFEEVKSVADFNFAARIFEDLDVMSNG